MQEAVPPGTGAMSAIMGLEPARLEQLCREATQRRASYRRRTSTRPGRSSSPGTPTPWRAWASSSRREKGRAIPLKVSAPFHCALMAPAARVVASRARTHRRPAARASPSSRTSTRSPNADAARVKELLVRQVDGPVRWEASVRVMAAAGVTHALEIGPGKVLAGLVKRIART